MPVDVGRLNKRITLYTYTISKNELGQKTQALVEYKKLWASVDPTSGREYYEAQKVRSELTWNIYTRWYKSFNPNPSMIIEYDNRKFKIISAIDYQETHEMYKFVCTEIVGDSFE